MRISLTTTVMLLCVMSPCLRADDVKPGESRFADDKFVEYIVGDTPVILSAPHGGRIKPDDVPDRTTGVLLSDTNTDKLARDFAEAYFKRTGKHAHVIIDHMHRVKVDCNRPVEDAVAASPGGEKLWRAYHGLIAEARDGVTKRFGQGFYIDLHGHAHPEPRCELGYLLKHAELKLDDDAVNKLAGKSSLKDLATRTKATFAELLRGPTSLGGLLEKHGIPCVPSPQHRDNGDGKYFNGGYCTSSYGSSQGGTISGLQIETPGPGVRNTDASRKKFAAALADAVVEYLKIHADLDVTK
ncbi:MAG: hypothetical protein GC159_06580 [Phycisphaera sp.]|nr:hypothetical protein [Phycisphaera sp.]